jgi:hypothetical protein
MSAKAVPCLFLLLCAGVAAPPARSASMQPGPSLAAPPQPASTDLAQPVPAHPAPALATTPPVMFPLTDKVISDAVRETLSEAPDNARRYEADTIRGNSYDEFSHQFSEARLPDCLHSEGLQRQPTFFLGGLLALPFIAVAKLRGVCR